MISKKTIKEEKRGLLCDKFNKWLKEVRLNANEREEIESIIDGLFDLIN